MQSNAAAERKEIAMASIKQKITPCLWFDTQAEDAAKFCISIFDNSRIRHVSRYGNCTLASNSVRLERPLSRWKVPES